MRLIKPLIMAHAATNVSVFCKFTGVAEERIFLVDQVAPKLPKHLIPQYADALDFAALVYMARNAETIVIDSKYILAFLNSVDRKLKPGDYPVPFDSFIIQFSSPISEKLFLHGGFTSGAPPMENDDLLGLLVYAPEEGSTLINVFGLYASTAINRVAVNLADGEIKREDLIKDITSEGWADKEKLLTLALLCIAFINTPKVVVEHVTVPEAVSRKRARKGKHKLDPYYLVKIENERHVYPARGAVGQPLSRMISVIGHWRHLEDGRVTWVRNHFKGTQFGPESMKVKVYTKGGQ